MLHERKRTELKQRKHLILLVEDDTFLRNLLSTQLAEHGYLVETAENGAQALDLIEAHPVDAVLTDIFMADMDGIELIQRLRKNFPDTPVFALSGGTHLAKPKDYLTYAKCFGATEVFVKPVEVSELVSKLEQYCRQSTEKPT